MAVPVLQRTQGGGRAARWWRWGWETHPSPSKPQPAAQLTLDVRRAPMMCTSLPSFSGATVWMLSGVTTSDSPSANVVAVFRARPWVWRMSERFSTGAPRGCVATQQQASRGPRGALRFCETTCPLPWQRCPQVGRAGISALHGALLLIPSLSTFFTEASLSADQILINQDFSPRGREAWQVC